jgi:predicted dithiol-disulfide oxidoreductase (DUF899 family)
LLGPPGWSLPVCEIDLRVGGVSRFVWRGPDGTDMGMRVYREIVPPERIGTQDRHGAGCGGELRPACGAVGVATGSGECRIGGGDQMTGVGSLSILGSAKRLFSRENSSTTNNGDEAMKTIETTITGHKVVSREDWIAARKALLTKEKESTQLRDQLSAERRKLPWVKVEKRYVFDGPDGKETLADLFDGHSQLVIYHFMFGPEWKEGCPSCSFTSDHIDGTLAHLAARDVTMVMVSRAPLAKIEAFKKRMDWRFKWVSSYGSDFNPDFHVSFTKEEMAQGKVNYNYTMQEFPSEEAPGISVFYKDAGGDVFHTYSTYGRGVEPLVGTYMILDMVPKGRDENHLGFTMEWVRHHDRYGTDEFADVNKPYWPATASPSSTTG